MSLLNPKAVRWIVAHTAAHPGDASWKDIDRWHKERGWVGIGYHFVIRKNGDLETGRSLMQVGAHVAGINSQSIGICCSGNGDTQPFTEAQVKTLIDLVARLCKEYKVEPRDFIGHREVNALIMRGVVAAKYATTKSCPGRKVNMEELRKLLVDALVPPPDPIELREAA